MSSPALRAAECVRAWNGRIGHSSGSRRFGAQGEAGSERRVLRSTEVSCDRGGKDGESEWFSYRALVFEGFTQVVHELRGLALRRPGEDAGPNIENH